MSYVGSISSPYESSTFGTSLSLKVNGGFNAVSINPSGRDIVLASRSGLFVIDLDDPFSPPRWLHHVTPWQVADVQWYPHPAKPYWVVSTSNQKAIIWNLTRSSTDAIEYALHGHSRAITDINFNPQNPDILATCSIDTYVHAWDMRSPARPFYSTSSWDSSASQVKWNFKDANILASSHGNDVFVWDVRQGSTPLHKLEGHESGVNSIDFNRFKRGEIMSSSNDGTVKFWDITKSDPCLKTISADFPIWRGRYLPFGNGYCIMPTVGGNNSVFLMSLNNDNDEIMSNSKVTTSSNNNFTIDNENSNGKIEKLHPVHTFKGHNDRVIEFLWRSRYSQNSDIDDREFQLVTWSKDSDLRLWPINDEIYDKVNFERNQRLKETLPNYEYISFNRCDNDNIEKTEDDNNGFIRVKEKFVTTSGLTRSEDINHLTWLSGVKMNRQDSQDDLFEDSKLQNLGEEVSSIGHKFPKIVFEKISVSTGELVLTLNGPWSETDPDAYIFLRIGVKFPPHYPTKGNPPKFEIEENNNLLPEKKHQILSKLAEIGKAYSDLNQYSLEPSLRYLLGEKVSLEDIEEIGHEPLFNFDINSHLDFDSFSSLSDMDDNSQLLDTSSSESESDLLKNSFGDEQNDARNTFGRNLAFDSTPVPNECGAIWTPSGSLFTFFAAKNKIERVTYNNLKLTQKTLTKKQNSSTYDPQELLDGDEDKTNYISRPKRYVDTFSVHDNMTEQDDATSATKSSSGSSFDSFADDWNDVIGNDILVRTKLPALYDNFTKTIGSLPSESVRTDSSRRAKNIIMETDFSHLIPDSKSLALEYQVVDGLPGEMARNNALIAEKFGFEEISHCWQILSDLLMGEVDNDPFSFASESHPRIVKWFVKEALIYFEKQHNLQMVAMLCCVLGYRPTTLQGSELRPLRGINMESIVTFEKENNLINQQTSDSSSYYSRNSNSMGNNMTSNTNLFDSHPNYSHLGIRDNNSMKSGGLVSNTSKTGRLINKNSPLRSKHSFHPYSHPRPSTVEKDSDIPAVKVQLFDDEDINIKDCSLHDILDSGDLSKYKRYVYQYSNLLFQWMLPIERTKILKVNINTLCGEIDNSGFSVEMFNNIDHHVESASHGVATCWLKKPTNSYTFHNCNYCQLRVTGDAFICGNCQHVLHRTCAREWWEIGDECPAGCGCDCPNFFDIQ